MPQSIIKRDGRVVLYDEEKIALAILKAMDAAGEPDADKATQIARKVGADFASRDAATPPQVEEIQDAVEQEMMKAGCTAAAKKYILYRASRTRVRDMNSHLMKVFDELTFTASQQSDMKRDNANIDGDTAMGTMLKYGSEASKDYYEKYLLTEEQAAAHQEGYIHIHDFDFYALTTTCCQIDLLQLFKGGFSTGHGYLREPNDIQSYAALACIAIQSNQNDQHGGQSIPNFDYGLAPGVAKTYQKRYGQNIARFCEVMEAPADLNAVKAWMHQIEDSAGLRPALCEDPRYFEAELPYLLEVFGDERKARKAQRFAAKNAAAETERATYQAMEALVHNLNTMHSRAGAQTPFSSINYGMDTSPEGSKGWARGKPPSSPSISSG